MSQNADPELSLGHQTRATHRAFDRLLQQHLGARGMANANWYVLRVLWDRDGICQRELADAMNLTESSTVTTIAAMEAAGLIRRERDPRDRRRIAIFLTPEAHRLRAELLPVAFQLNAIAAGDLPAEDLATYLRVARAMRDNLLAAAKTPDLTKL